MGSFPASSMTKRKVERNRAAKTRHSDFDGYNAAAAVLVIP
jgi:hypothetical protein